MANHPSIAAIMAEVGESMGEGVIQRGTSSQVGGVLSTGSFKLDFALLGGIPESQCTMLFGWEAAGKTTIAMRIAGGMLRKYPERAVAYVDFEGTFDAQWASYHGLDPDAIYRVQPETAENGVDILDALARTPETGLIVVDSLPAMMPFEDLDKSAEDKTMATRARLIGNMCGKLVQARTVHRNASVPPPTIIFINQYRMKVGFVMGDPRVLPGGQQPRYFASCMVELKNKENVGVGLDGVEKIVSNKHSFKITKFKGSSSTRTGDFTMIRDPRHPLGQGFIDDALSVFTTAKLLGLAEGSGRTHVILGVDKVFKNSNEVVQWLYANPDEFLRLKQLCIMHYRASSGLAPTPTDRWIDGAISQGDIDRAIASATEE